MISRVYNIIFYSHRLKMNTKQQKHEASVDGLQSIIKKLRQKGPDFLEKQQMAVCIITVGFPDVCKKLGVQWNSNIQKQFKNKLEKLQIDVSWVDRKSSAQIAPFLVHCTRGDITKIKDFIKKTPKQEKQILINAFDSAKRSALHLTAKQGYDVLVDYLITEKFKVNSRDKQLKTPLHYACIGNHERSASSLIANNADVFAKDYKGQTPLHCAVRTGNSQIVAQLLQKGPRMVDNKDFVGKTPLHYAAISSNDGQVDVIRMLFENGARVDERDNDGRTPLHYACQYGKTRSIPILLKNRASVNIRDNAKNSPLDLASNNKVKKIIQAYCQQKLIVDQSEQKQFTKQYKDKLQKSQIKDKNGRSNLKQTKNHQKQIKSQMKITSNNPLLGGETNQVSTWLRQKFFVLMKKLQESGVKIRYHIKKPFIYTGSWMEQIQSIQQLFVVFGELSGPEVAMRIFNILCPYEKKLPTGISTIDAVEGFFGESWFGGQSAIDNAKKTGKGEVKLKKELEDKQKQLEEYKIANIGYQSQLEKLESKLSQLNDQLKQYKKIQEEVRKERVKNAKQYSQILKMTNQIEDLKKEVSDYEAGHDVNKNLQEKIQQLIKKNEDLSIEIQSLKSYEAAARRKCGKIFLKSLHNPVDIDANSINNLYDDDSIIHLYELLHNNPPNMIKRLQKANRSGKRQLTVFEFNYFLQELGMLPQDIMSMNRIVGFVSGRKLLPIEEFKQILQNRPQIRVEWERKLLNKIKSIIKHSQIGSVQKLFQLLDKDGSHSLSIGQLKQGLQQYNIYINQNDINNLFSLIDSDRSGQINLQELSTLLQNGVSSKKLPTSEEFEEKAEQSHNQKQQENQNQNQYNQEENQADKKEEQGENNQQNQQQENQQRQDQNLQQNQYKSVQFDEENKEEQEQYPESPEKKYSVTSSDLHNDQFLKAMEEDTSDLVNGKCKVQILYCKNIPNQQQLNRVIIKIQFYGGQYVKVGDFSRQKWEIAVDFQIKDKRKSWVTPLVISVYTQRQYDQEHFLGMVQIPFQTLFQKNNVWAINGSLQLSASPKYQKQVSGKIGVQARWTNQEPKTQKQQQQEEEVQH